jgi:hypothetical protein
MRSRRHFCRLSLVALLAAAARRPLGRPEALSSARLSPQGEQPKQIYLPLVRNALCPDDMPIVGPPSGSQDRAFAWLAPRAGTYAAGDVAAIVADYRRIGEAAALDWFLALAQMAHETGSLTSWWSQRPRRNPAGIGVTGRVVAGTPDSPPGRGWSWDGTQWREGWSFPTWADHAIPAHLGRLLAYALRDQEADAAQQALIGQALTYRPLPAGYRGAAPTVCGLNGRWAVPGTNYGQGIIELARLMRDGV